MEEAADNYIKAVGQAVDQQDFTTILAVNRHFSVYVCSNIYFSFQANILRSGSRSSETSFGSGVETEVLVTAFEKVTASTTKWFHPGLDEFSSLRVFAHGFVHRIREVAIFGAFCALKMAFKQPPARMFGPQGDRIDPLVLQLLIHEGDIHSLHPSLVGEWHPQLRHELQAWLDMGPTGDARLFNSLIVSHLGYEVSSSFKCPQTSLLTHLVHRPLPLMGETKQPTNRSLSKSFIRLSLGPLNSVIRSGKAFSQASNFLVATGLLFSR